LTLKISNDKREDGTQALGRDIATSLLYEAVRQIPVKYCVKGLFMYRLTKILVEPEGIKELARKQHAYKATIMQRKNRATFHTSTLFLYIFFYVLSIQIHNNPTTTPPQLFIFQRKPTKDCYSNN
jgi:hypothetical protein